MVPSPTPEVARIQDVITTFIVRELLRTRDAAIDPEVNLFTDGYVDSVGIMRLIAHLEAAFDLRIPPTDLVPDNFRSVSVMARYLAGRRREPTSAAAAPPAQVGSAS